MGKGKRNRAKRKNAVDPARALDQLLEISTKEEFLALVASCPEAIGAPVSRKLSEMTAASYGDIFKRWERLVRAAREDPAAAWEEHEKSLARDNATSEELGQVIEEIQEAERQQEPKQVIQLVESAIARQ